MIWHQLICERSPDNATSHSPSPFEHIESFNKREHRRTTLGNLSPTNYESQHTPCLLGLAIVSSNRGVPMPAGQADRRFTRSGVTLVNTPTRPSTSVLLSGHQDEAA
jgi:hypothetical protein